MTAFVQSQQVALRHVRFLLRQPAFLAITLSTPVIWLLLFGSVFRRAVDIPGFDGGSYVEFLTPGVVVMTALFSAVWTGMSFIDDIDRGVMDRLLVAPAWRAAFNVGSIVQASLSVAVQALIVVGLAFAVGARFDAGAVAVLVVTAVLVGAAVAGLSNGLALHMRQREALIGATQLISLPLMFLSSAFMQASLLPAWIRSIARFNPIDWAVQAGRSATTGSPDWSLVGSRLGLLAALAVLATTFATRAFRSYQRSL
jgi:ABC-2 type transport system permease protein